MTCVRISRRGIWGGERNRGGGIRLTAWRKKKMPTVEWGGRGQEGNGIGSVEYGIWKVGEYTPVWVSTKSIPIHNSSP